MIARHFDRHGCIIGLKFRTYASLEKWYVCNWCGSQIVHHFSKERDWAQCNNCGSENFIPQWLFDKQCMEGPGIVKTLPEDVQALFSKIEPVSMEQAIDEIWGL